MSRNKTEIVLPDYYDIIVEENKIRKFWQKNKIFENISATRSKENEGRFYIHSAPVFPIGAPHSGQVLNIVVKDAVKRYALQRNLKVETAFAWNCHGLPVEHEVEKKLGISSLNDVQAIGGGAAFNEKCRKFVERNISEWKSVFSRVGNWVDDSEQYQTMSAECMEGVWWVFKQLYDRGLVYKAKKVLPYSTACRTHLSNFEAEQNLKEVTEVGWTISVSIVGTDEKLLIWTTTPVALVSNSAICTNPKTTYVKVKVIQQNGREAVYIISKNRVGSVFKNPSEYAVVDELLGKELQDLRYEPLFDGVAVSGNNRVITEDGVDDDVGSGLMPLDELLIDLLKERGHVIGVEKVRYKKPHCWRSDTPLVNKRVETWFIRVEGITEDLHKNIDGVSWLPDEDLKEKQISNCLKDHCMDWAVGRSRSWGTPIPIWSSPSGDEVVCIGSIEELKRLTGKKALTSMYKECLDWLVIPSRIPGNPPLRRVPDVFDCWFESGALPFAQGRHLSEKFKADLAVEGVDQTRGWFYTMLVLSTALSKPAPFVEVVATGSVLNTDGLKMSKRKHNNHDPLHLTEKYGIDAVRLYLLSTSVLEGQDVAMQENGVVEMVQSVIEPLYRIFRQCNSQLGDPKIIGYSVSGISESFLTGENVIDAWLCTYSESVLKTYHEEMAAYRLPNALKAVIELIKQTEEWYLPHFIWTPNQKGQREWHSSTIILIIIVHRCTMMLAPFAPHLAEYIFQIQHNHYCLYPHPKSIHDMTLQAGNSALIKHKIMLRVSRMQKIVKLIRKIRAHYIVPPKYQISDIFVVHHIEGFRQDIELASEFIKIFVNTKNVYVSNDLLEFGATLKAELKPSSEFYNDKTVTSALRDMSIHEMGMFIRREHPSFLHISADDFRVSYNIKSEYDSLSLFSAITEDDILVIMKMNKPLFYYEEGTLKELSRRIKILKKKSNYYHSDFAVIYYTSKDNYFENLINMRREYLKTKENCDLIFKEHKANMEGLESVEETVDIKGMLVRWYLYYKID